MPPRRPAKIGDAVGGAAPVDNTANDLSDAELHKISLEMDKALPGGTEGNGVAYASPNGANETADPMRVSQAGREAIAGFREAENLAIRPINITVEEYLNQEPEEEGTWLWWQWKFATYVEHPTIRAFWIVLVCINGIIIGIGADNDLSSEPWPTLEYFFTFAFTVEIILKLFALGFLFWTEAWNNFDFVIVALALFDFASEQISGGSTIGAPSTIFRMLRVFRVIRLVGFLDRLNLLVQSFVGALQSVGWVIALLVMVLYIFAIMANQFFGNQDTPSSAKDLFGNVPRSMASLTQIMTMDSWASQISRPIGDEFPISWGFFIFFLGVASLGLLNLLTAIFIDALTEQTKAAEAKLQLKKGEERDQAVQLMQQMFKTFDADNSGNLDSEEVEKFFKVLDNPHYAWVSEAVGVTTQDMKDAVRLCDTDGDGTIDYEEFLAGCRMMNDASVKKDAWELQAKVNVARRKLLMLDEKIDKGFAQAEAKLDALLKTRNIFRLGFS